jgi:pimeloyl-ACP methyl ester carboxylesterase
MPKIATPLLEIEYECGGPEHGPRVLLLHGWPDDPRGWRHVTPFLTEQGYCWVTPPVGNLESDRLVRAG